MKKGKWDLLRILSILLLFILLAMLYYAFSIPCYPCEKPAPMIMFVAYAAEIITFLAAAVIAYIKSYKYTFALALIMIIVFVLATNGIRGCPSLPMTCLFNSHLSCVSYKLNAGTSKLEINLGNSLEHDIRINGLKCTKAVAWGASAPAFIEPLNESIIIKHGSISPVVGFATSNVVYCTTENGAIPPDTSIATLACLNVFVNYTDIITGQSNITYGRIGCRYEAG